MKNKGTFSLNKGKPIYSWYQYIEGYSEEFVLNEIEKLGNIKSVYDPFGGSGTTMLYAALNGIKSYYCEINPFMAWVSDTKINCARRASLKIDELKETYKQIVCEIKNLKKYYPKDSNNDFSRFYDKDVYLALFGLKNLIKKVCKDSDFYNICMLALASNTLHVSNMIKSGDVRFANEKELKRKNKDIISLFISKLESMIDDLETTGNQLSEEAIKLSDDSRNIDAIQVADCVITSPPYLNGTNYIRNTKLELNLLDFIQSESDVPLFHSKGIIAGINNVSARNFKVDRHFECVEEVLKKLRPVAYDKRIPMMVEGYFDNMSVVIDKIHDILKIGGTFVLDIGDSQFSGVHIPTHELLEKICILKGFEKVNEEILRTRYSNNGMVLSQRIIRFRRVS